TRNYNHLVAFRTGSRLMSPRCELSRASENLEPCTGFARADYLHVTTQKQGLLAPSRQPAGCTSACPQPSQGLPCPVAHHFGQLRLSRRGRLPGQAKRSQIPP